MANHLVALAFDSPLFAQEAMIAALRLQDRGELALHEAVFVSRHTNAQARVTASLDPTPLAVAIPAILVGALIGAIAFGPLGFLCGGLIAGCLGGGLAKVLGGAIPREAIRRLRAAARPGQTMIVLLVSDIAGRAAIAELHRFEGAELVYAQLPAEACDLVRRALQPR